MTQILLVLTTVATQADAQVLAAALRAQHPYELPAIVAVPCAHALPAFADWVATEVAPA